MIRIASPVYRLADWAGNVQDDYGVDWVVEQEEGWSSSPPVRTRVEDREGRHGAWGGPGFFSARVVTLTGTAIAPDRVTMLHAKERLRGAPDAETLRDLVVEEAHMTRMARVRLGGDVKITDRGSFAFTWSLTLIAADPLRYSTDFAITRVDLPYFVGVGRTYPRTYPVSYGGASGAGILAVSNRGNAPTGGLVRFYGPVSNPGIEHLSTGKRVQYGLRLATASEWLEVDLDRQTTLLMGTASRRSTLAPGSAWFLWQPGENQARFLGQGSAVTPDVMPSMEVTIRSAWR